MIQNTIHIEQMLEPIVGESLALARSISLQMDSNCTDAMNNREGKFEPNFVEIEFFMGQLNGAISKINDLVFTYRDQWKRALDVGIEQALEFGVPKDYVSGEKLRLIEFNKQFTEWQGDSDGSVGCD
jgi:hypothetical protein